MQNRNAINKIRDPSAKKSLTGLEFVKNQGPDMTDQKLLKGKII